MNSFNHYAFGAVADWLHRVVGGLAPAAPGWRELRIAPRPGGGLTLRIEPSRHALRLRVVGRGRSYGDTHRPCDAVVPPNTTAHVLLPGTDRRVRRRIRGALVDGGVRTTGGTRPDTELAANSRPTPGHEQRRHPPRPGLARHQRQPHPGPRRLDPPRGRHLLLVRREQGERRPPAAASGTGACGATRRPISTTGTTAA